MKHFTTPLHVLMGATALVAAAPESFGPSAADRRLMSPADMSGHGHSPTQMADPARGMTLVAGDVLGGGAKGKIDAMHKGDNDAATGHLQATMGASNQEASTGAVVFSKQS